MAISGINWILAAQNETSGGFSGFDIDAITFNDDVMTGTMRLLRDIKDGKEYFAVLPEELKTKAGAAYERGIRCILDTQITVTLDNGSELLTAWCQQHSHVPPHDPVWARSFEPPSISSIESFKVLKLLMEIPDPYEKVKRAILAGCEFFDRSDVRISGKKLIYKEIEPVTLNGRTYTSDRFLVDDASAKDLWARFYALDDSYDVISGAPCPIKGNYPEVLRPVWCDRDCEYRDSYNDLSQERRNGYYYVISSGHSLLKTYEAWKEGYLTDTYR